MIQFNRVGTALNLNNTAIHSKSVWDAILSTRDVVGSETK